MFWSRPSSMYMALRRTRDRPRRQALVVLKVRRTGGLSLQQGTGPNLQCKLARFLAGNGVVAIYAFGDRRRIGRSADESGHYSRRFNYAAFEDKSQEGSAGHSSPGTNGFGAGSC
jgi:hypothetical protein